MLYSEYQRPTFFTKPELDNALRQRQAYLTPTDQPSTWWERAKLQALSYNSLSLLGQYQNINNFYEEDGYNPADDIMIQNNRWIRDIYPDQWSSLMESKSSKYSFSLITNIQKNHSTAMTLAEGSFISNLTSGLVAGLVDPINYFSFGAGNVIKGGKTATSALNATRLSKQAAKIKNLSFSEKAAYGVYTNMAATMMVEPLMQDANVTRTAEDAWIDTIASGVLGAGFAGGAHAFGKSVDAAKQKAVRAATGGYDSVEEALRANNQTIWDLAHNTPEKKAYWDKIETIDDIFQMSQQERAIGDKWIKEAQASVFKSNIPGLEKIQRWMFLNPGQQMFNTTSDTLTKVAQELLEFNLEMNNQVANPAIESKQRMVDFIMSHHQQKHDSLIENWFSDHGEGSHLEMYQVKDRVYDLIRSGYKTVQEAGTYRVLKRGKDGLELVDAFADVRADQSLVKVIEEAAEQFRNFMTIVDNSSNTAGLVTRLGHGKATEVERGKIRTYAPVKVDKNKLLHKYRLDENGQSVDDFVEAIKQSIVDMDQREMSEIEAHIRGLVDKTKTIEKGMIEDPLYYHSGWAIDKLKEYADEIKFYEDQYNMRADRSPEDLYKSAKNTVANYENGMNEYDVRPSEGLNLGVKHGLKKKLDVDNRFLRPFMITDTSALMEYARLQIIPKLILSDSLQSSYSKNYNGMITAKIKEVENYENKIRERDRYREHLKQERELHEEMVNNIKDDMGDGWASADLPKFNPRKFIWKYNLEDWEKTDHLMEKDAMKLNNLVDEVLDLMEESKLDKEMQFILEPSMVRNPIEDRGFESINEMRVVVQDIIERRAKLRDGINQAAVKEKEGIQEFDYALWGTGVVDDMQEKMHFNSQLLDYSNKLKRIQSGLDVSQDFDAIHKRSLVPVTARGSLAVLGVNEIDFDPDKLVVTYEGSNVNPKAFYDGKQVRVHFAPAAKSKHGKNMDITNYQKEFGDKVPYVVMEPIDNIQDPSQFNIYSGGAEGSDRMFGDFAAKFGIPVEHIHFEIETTKAKLQEVGNFLQEYIDAEKEAKKQLIESGARKSEIKKAQRSIDRAYKELRMYREEWDKATKSYDALVSSYEKRTGQKITFTPQAEIDKLHESRSELSKKISMDMASKSHGGYDWRFSNQKDFPIFDESGALIGREQRKVINIPHGRDNLMLRNALIIDKADSVMAIGQLDRFGNIKSGTGWAINYAIDMTSNNPAVVGKINDKRRLSVRGHKDIYVFNPVDVLDEKVGDKPQKVLFPKGWYKYEEIETKGSTFEPSKHRGYPTKLDSGQENIDPVTGKKVMRKISGGRGYLKTTRDIRTTTWRKLNYTPVLSKNTALIGHRTAVDEPTLKSIANDLFQTTFNPSYSGKVPVVTPQFGHNAYYLSARQQGAKELSARDKEDVDRLYTQVRKTEIELELVRFNNFVNDYMNYVFRLEENLRKKIKPKEGEALSAEDLDPSKLFLSQQKLEEYNKAVVGMAQRYSLGDFRKYPEIKELLLPTVLAKNEPADMYFNIEGIQTYYIEKAQDGLLQLLGRTKYVTKVDDLPDEQTLLKRINRDRADIEVRTKKGLGVQDLMWKGNLRFPASREIAKKGIIDSFTAVQQGLKTQTSEKTSRGTNQEIQNISEGDILAFTKRATKRGPKQTLYVRVTKKGKVGDEYKSVQEWAKKEGVEGNSPEALTNWVQIKNYWFIQYELTVPPQRPEIEQWKPTSFDKIDYRKKERRQASWAWVDPSVLKTKQFAALMRFKEANEGKYKEELFEKQQAAIQERIKPTAEKQDSKTKYLERFYYGRIRQLTNEISRLDDVIEAKKLGYVDIREEEPVWKSQKTGEMMVGDQKLSEFEAQQLVNRKVGPEDPRFYFVERYEKLEKLYEEKVKRTKELNELVNEFDLTTKDLNTIGKGVSEMNQNAPIRKAGYGKRHVDNLTDQEVEQKELPRLGFKTELGYLNKYNHNPDQLRGLLGMVGLNDLRVKQIVGLTDFAGIVRQLADIASTERLDNYTFYLKSDFIKQKMLREGELQGDQLEKAFSNLDFVFGDLRNEKISSRLGEDFDKTMRIIKNLNYMRYMGMVTIASLGDFANAIGTMGLTGYARTMVTYFGNFKDRKDIAVLPNLIAAGEIAGIENRATRLMDTEAQGTFLDPITMAPRSTAGSSKLSRGINWLDEKTNQNSKVMTMYNKFGNFLGVWNSFNKRMVTLGLEDMVVRAALKGDVVNGRYVNSSKKRVLGMLKAMRFSDQDLLAIKQNYLKHGSTKTNIVGGDFYLSGFEKWDNTDSFTTYDYHAKIEGAVNHIIVTPGLADLPKWFKIPEVSPFVQFKSFLFASTNRMFLPMIQRYSLYRDPNQVAMFFSTAMLGSLSYLIYEIMSGRDPMKDSEIEKEDGTIEKRSWVNKMVLEGIDRGGSVAFLFSLSNILDRHAGIGVHSLFGGELNRKYRARTLNDFITGPIGGLADDIQKSLTAVSDLLRGNEVTESQLTSMRRVAPAQNAISIRAAVDIAPSALDAFFKPNNWTKNYLDNYRPIQGRAFDMLNQE